MNRIDELKREVETTQVLVFAGGFGKRMGAISIPKPLLPIGGRPLIDRCIDYFSSCGFKKFVILLGYQGEVVKKHLEEKSPNVSLTFCFDPPLRYVGKAKALKHAIQTGAIDKKHRCIVCFPDDIFLEPSLPLKLLLHHLEGVRLYGTKATAVFTSAIEYPYGTAEIDDRGLVTEFREKPIVRIFTSTGLYAFEPDVYNLILDLVDMSAERPIEFEEIILPKLAREGKLYSMVISRGIWLPINTLKELEKAEELLSQMS